MDREFPKFKYQPHAYTNGIFKHGETEVCDCCGNETDVYYDGPFFSEEEIECLCPWCIADGSAAEKFDGEFQDEFSCDEVDDPEKTDELIRHTPGYCGWQQEYWLAHCNDYCAFVAYVGWKELLELCPDEAPEEIYRKDVSMFDLEELGECMTNGGGLQGYLFQCLHCGKHFLYADCD